jgi:hypothetical protein
MDKGRRIKLVLSGCLVLFLIISSVIMSLEREGELSDVEDVQGVLDLYNVPKIVTVAPVSVLSGEEYYYVVGFNDGDTEVTDLVLDIVEGPEWLSVEGNVVRGVARGVGTYRVVLRVSDGENFSERKHYILVEES